MKQRRAASILNRKETSFKNIKEEESRQFALKVRGQKLLWKYSKKLQSVVFYQISYVKNKLWK